MPLKIVYAEDNYLVREGVVRLIATQPDLEVAAVCDDLDSLLSAVDEHNPDVVLTDIRMPPSHTNEGIAAAKELRATHPSIGIVVLSQFDDPAYALDYLGDGSEGRAYLLKERVSDIEQLAAAIREVARGGSVIDPKVVEALIKAKSRSEKSPLGALTPREREILAEMAQGRNNAAIAEALFVTERAVEKHIHSIFSKLGLSEEPNVHRRVKAVLLFLSSSGDQAR